MRRHPLCSCGLPRHVRPVVLPSRLPHRPPWGHDTPLCFLAWPGLWPVGTTGGYRTSLAMFGGSGALGALSCSRPLLPLPSGHSMRGSPPLPFTPQPCKCLRWAGVWAAYNDSALPHPTPALPRCAAPMASRMTTSAWPWQMAFKWRPRGSALVLLLQPCRSLWPAPPCETHAAAQPPP